MAVGTVALAAFPRAVTATDTVTSFEFTDLDGNFDVGTSPNGVTFVNGAARTVGVPGLYRTGSNAWMIDPGGTGTITLESAADRVELWLRNEAGAGASTVTAFDESDAIVGSTAGTSTFQLIVVAPPGAARVKRLTVANTGAAGRTVVDDFSVCTSVAPAPIDDPIPAPIGKGGVTIQLSTLASGLTAPNWGASAPGDPNRLFVSDQAGPLWAIDLVTGARSMFLDTTPHLVPLGIAGPGTFDERGLLGFAFHPDYAGNGRLYTYTSEPALGTADFSTMPPGASPNHQSVVTEWTVPNPASPASVADPGSRRIVLRIDEPQFNHNAGALAFGPYGLLYIALGDGGNADDEGVGHGATGNGQDPSTVLGTILRIDPMGTTAANGQYAVPADNPFVGVPGFVPEIWAYGFRNPFRFSFDQGTGNMFIADVGQNDVEEIDLGVAGGNYGWPLMEGSFFFQGNGPGAGFVTNDDPGGSESLIRPIAQYDHDEGLAVIGGFVYRGQTVPSLVGRYVFGDFARTFSNDGRLFHLDAQGTVAELRLADQPALGRALLGFGQDAAGEIYVLANDTGTPFGETGVVLRLGSPGPLCGPVPVPASSCRQAAAGKSALTIVDKTPGVPGAKDALLWTWNKGDATPLAALGAPTAGSGVYRLCLYDGAGLRREIDVPAGGICGRKPCWKPIGKTSAPKGFAYKNTAALPDGIVSILLRTGDQAKAQVRIGAKGIALNGPSLPLATPVTAQLLIATEGSPACWQTTFPTARKNSGEIFRAKGP